MNQKEKDYHAAWREKNREKIREKQAGYRAKEAERKTITKTINGYVHTYIRVPEKTRRARVNGLDFNYPQPAYNGIPNYALHSISKLK